MIWYSMIGHGRNHRCDVEGGIVNKVARIGLAAICCAGVGAAAAWASEAITYSYDARGRLVKVEHSGSVNNNVSVTYTYDRADNRNSVTIVSPNPPP